MSDSWNREQNKAFENAIATHKINNNNTNNNNEINEDNELWEKIALLVPGGKTVEEIKHHYKLLVEDVFSIESGLVPVPCYSSDETGSSDETEKTNVGNNSKLSKLDKERRKGIPWSQEEHRLFLLGLEKYGKGDWRSISRNFVVTRTPTQVASHAQKYFIRLNSMNKDRRRTSIHDITSVVINNGKDSFKPPQ